ncbi:response regulator [Paenibacillus athensensis]|uniref:Circadian input-output histidine kinase CikA n=1 Tax=Paenibacillus athensensis TaxID=1967502 RepID=A0A4Y8PUM5_9BACL|nr:ATP-binding protein [Paenibacillus athensensis]MCD1261724.1 response regulator [Paenibacillus athensensis]
MNKITTLGFIFFVPLIMLVAAVHLPMVEPQRGQTVTNIEYARGDFTIEQIAQIPWNRADAASKTQGAKDKTLWVKLHVPAQLQCASNCHLYIRQIYEIYEVYVDGKTVYTYGDFQQPHRFYGRNLNLIPLGAAVPGDIVYVKIHSELNKIGIRGTVLVADQADIIDFLYKKNFVQYGIVFLLMLFLALFFFILGLRRGKNGSYLLLALYLFTHAAHTWTSTDVKFFIYNAPTCWEYIRQYCNDAIPIAFILFIRSFFVEYAHNRIFKWWTNLIFCMHIVFLGLLIGYQFSESGIKHITETLGEIGNVNFIITVIAIVGLTLKKAKADTRILAWGLVCYLLFNLYDNFLKISNAPYTESIVPYGLLLMMVSILCIHIRRTNEMYRNQENYLLQLEQSNEQLERLSAMKDEFLANTSHELRTPLNGIIGIAESVLESLDGPAATSVETTRSNLHMVVSSGKRLRNLVNDLLDFSKLKHRQIELDRKSVDVVQLIHTVLSVSKTLVRGKELQFVNRTEEALYAYGDENRLQQILFNLVGNAIKFTEKGTITVAAHRSAARIEIRVSDTGIGIPNEQLERIFQSFEQADRSISRKYGGTGLGLTITKQLVEMHGGAIRAESVAGQGSTFIFTLPFAEDEPAAQEAAALHPVFVNDHEQLAAVSSPRNPDSPIQILLVEDDPINIQVVLNHLSMHSWGTVVATDGFQALDIVASRPIDLLLLDVMMPGMSGYEVCEKVREVYAPEELPILMLSARDTADDIARGFEAGANDYISKPFLKKELLARIEARLYLQELKKSKSVFTKTEKEILNYYYEYQGETRRQILERINTNRGPNAITEKTLTSHITNMLKKISADNITDAAKLAKSKKWI